jgi:hypothetical protein
VLRQIALLCLIVIFFSHASANTSGPIVVLAGESTSPKKLEKRKAGLKREPGGIALMSLNEGLPDFHPKSIKSDAGHRGFLIIRKAARTST